MALRSSTALKGGVAVVCAGLMLFAYDAEAGKRALPGYYLLEAYVNKPAPKAAPRIVPHEAASNAPLPWHNAAPEKQENAQETPRKAPQPAQQKLHFLPWLAANYRPTQTAEITPMKIACCVDDPNDPNFVPPVFEQAELADSLAVPTSKPQTPERPEGNNDTPAPVTPEAPIAVRRDEPVVRPETVRDEIAHVPAPRIPREKPVMPVQAVSQATPRPTAPQHRSHPVVQEEETLSATASTRAVDSALGGETEVVSNDELGDIRGGFVASNGMIVDVGLVTQTLVDGALAERTEIASADLKNLKPSDLQTLVQVNAGNTAVRRLSLDQVPQIIRAIQNDRNDVVIDNLTILNVDVRNVAAFNLQAQVNNLNAQIVQGTLR